MKNLKVAIVHYWLDSYRGGEKVVEALCEIYPQADIYTHMYKPVNLPESITSHRVFTTFISKLPFAWKFYRHYLPLMPLALLFLNLKKYDLIISSESGPAKGIRKRKDALHICYCHSPMRYIWDMEEEYMGKFRQKTEDRRQKTEDWRQFASAEVRKCGNAKVREWGSSEVRKCGSAGIVGAALCGCPSAKVRECESFKFNKLNNSFLSNIQHSTFNIIFKFLWKIIACYMRCWDRKSAQKVDHFIVNSKFIAARVRKFYKRNSTVIHPPVEINKFNPGRKRGNFYLCVSQLVSYKKVKMVVEAFNILGLPLCVIGGGDELEEIKRVAKGNIQILGKVSDEVLKEKFETCKAFVYAGKEDFGIVFAEALSAGTPVIAYRKGGVRDIVVKNKTGIFFADQTLESIVDAVRRFATEEVGLLSPLEISKQSQKFSKECFKKKIIEIINLKI